MHKSKPGEDKGSNERMISKEVGGGGEKLRYGEPGRLGEEPVAPRDFFLGVR